MEQLDGVGEIALIVGLGGGDDGRRDEIVLRRRRLHQEAAAEQFADQRLEHDVGREILLQIVVRAHDRFDRLAHALPDRILEPVLLAGGNVEARRGREPISLR